MAFDTQITDLVGGTIDQTACDQWMTEGVMEVINQLPLDLKKKCASIQSFTSVSAGSESESLGEGDVLSVFAGDHKCRLIGNGSKYHVSDPGDITYATSTDPVYYFEADKINVLPAGLSCKYEEVQYTAVNASDVSSISNFPDEAEYLVVLYAAIKQLHQYMNLKSVDLPSFALPPVPTRTAQTAFSSYTSGLSETDPGVFSITAVSPAVPSLSTTSVSFSATAPTFTKPAVAPDFAQVNTYIDTNEDIELASAKLQEISSQLNEYSANIQNEQIEFNKESVEYQAQLQISMQNAQFDNQEDARKLQKYQAELSTYQANINKEVQQYGQKLSQYQLELNTSYQAWAKTESDNIQAYQVESSNYQAQVSTRVQEFTQNLQKHSTDYQWLASQYAQLKSDYQQGLQALRGGGSPQPAQQGR